MEKVVQANFFHHFREKNFLINSWKRWRQLSQPTFSTTQAVLDAQIVENIGFDNFVHLFLRFERLPQKFVEKAEKVVLANFFHDSSRFGGPNRGKCWPGQLFPPFLWFQRLPQKFVEKVEKVGLANFFHDSSRFGGPNGGKSWPGQLSTRFANTFHAC